MLVKVQKWGNSQGIRLSKDILAGANILIGDELEIISTKDQLEIAKQSNSSRVLKNLIGDISTYVSYKKLE